MKKVVSVLCIVFLLLLFLNAKEIVLEIHKSGGKVIKTGNNKGKLGYNSVRIYKHNTADTLIYTVYCSGKGVIAAPSINSIYDLCDAADIANWHVSEQKYSDVHIYNGYCSCLKREDDTNSMSDIETETEQENQDKKK